MINIIYVQLYSNNVKKSKNHGENSDFISIFTCLLLIILKLYDILKNPCIISSKSYIQIRFIEFFEKDVKEWKKILCSTKMKKNLNLWFTR